MHKMGSLSPVIYFINHRDPAQREGYIMLAPYSAYRTPDGWSREEAGTLRDCYRLQQRLQLQDAVDLEREGAQDIAAVRARFQATRERMLTRMRSSSTTPYDRDFMEAYLQLQEDKLAKHEQRFLERNTYLWALEHDAAPHRRDDEETVNLDRVNF